MSQQGQETYVIYNLSFNPKLEEALDELGIDYKEGGEEPDYKDRPIIEFKPLGGQEIKRRGLEGVAQALDAQDEIQNEEKLRARV